MAATITQSGGSTTPGVSSHLYAALVDVVGDATYTTGGYAVALATVLPTGAKVVHVVPSLIAGGFVPVWDAANGKIKLMSVPVTPSNSALQEVTAGTNVSTATIRLVVLYEVSS